MHLGRLSAAVCVLVLGIASDLLGQAKELGALVPDKYPLCITVPNIKQSYERYQATGVGKLFSSPAMAPFTAELRKTGAISLVNWQGILGFDDKLLSQFPVSGVIMGVPVKETAPAPKPVAGARPPKPKGNIIVLIETKDAAAINACLKNAEAYLTGQGAKKKAETVKGAANVTVFDTPASPNHPALQHVYFQTDTGFFGIGSNVDAVKEYLGLKLDAANPALATKEEFVSGRKQLNPASDVFIYTRPVETLELWEDHPKKGEKSAAAKMKSQGFRNLAAITAVVQFTGAAHDLDYQAIFFVKWPPPKAGEKPKTEDPFIRGLRILKFSPGPEAKVPAWLPSGLGELSQLNHNQKMLFDVRGNWYDELEAAGAEGTFRDLMNNLKTTGVKVDFEADVFGKLKDPQFHLVDTRGAVTKENPLGRITTKIAEFDPMDGKKLTEALTDYFKADVAMGATNLESIGAAKIWWTPPPKPLMMEANRSEGQSVNTMAVVDQYYITSNDTAFVRALVKKAGDFSKDTVLANLAAENRKLQSAKTGSRTAVRWEVVWEAPFEATRSADKKYDNEREVKLLRMILTGDNTLKYAGLYKLLPPFSATKPFLSPAGCTVDMVDDGLLMKGFILKP